MLRHSAALVKKSRCFLCFVDLCQLGVVGYYFYGFSIGYDFNLVAVFTDFRIDICNDKE